jgi:predicted dehydrogenase
MTVPPLRLGLIGNARITRHRILPAIDRCTSVAAVAIAARDAEAAACTAATHGITASYGSYDALLAQAHIEAVYIALPNALHAEWTIRALRAGKHVLCEKPMAMTATQVDRIATVARETGRIAVEALMIRHHPRWHSLLSLVSQGAIGNLRSIQGRFAFPLPPANNIRGVAALGGGVLADLGIYLVSSALLIAGRMPARVNAILCNADEIDRSATIMLDFGEATASGFCSFDAPLAQSLFVLGSGGAIAMHQPFNPTADTATSLILTEQDHSQEVIEFAPVDQFALQFYNFAAAVRGIRCPAYPLTQSLAAHRTIDALRLAAADGRWIDPSTGAAA